MIKMSVVLSGVIGAGVLLLSAVSMGAPSGGVGFVRVNEVCGQATECEKKLFKICSTFHADHSDFACTKGCETELEP